MRTKNFLKHLILGALVLTTCKAVGQVTTGSNVASGPTDFLGWDNTGTNNFPLRVRHDLNQPIEWYTDSLRRMLLSPTLTGSSVNGYPGLDLSGHLGIGDFTSFSGTVPPVSLLHLDDGGTQVAGFRPWMETGVTMTRQSDWMYVGLKEDTTDRINAIVNWGDNLENDTVQGPDALRFIFTRSRVGASAAASDDGLEVGRMIPDENGNEGYFGIGDFFNGGAEPDERLDVLDRTMRLRRVIPDYRNDTLHQVLMSDMNGRVHWRNINTWPSTGTGTADCKWTLLGTGNANIATAYASNPGCPQADRKVGIGLFNPTYKLDVFAERSVVGSEGAIQALFEGADISNWQKGIWGRVIAESTTVQKAVGVAGNVSNISVDGRGIEGGVSLDGVSSESTTASAIYGRVNTTSQAKGTLYGTRGEVSNLGSNGTRSAYGSYGKTSGTGALAGSYGMYGESYVQGTTTTAMGGYGKTLCISGSDLGKGYGLYGISSASNSTMDDSYGVYGQASGGTTANYGVYGKAADGTTRYGVYGEATNASTADTLSTSTRWAGFFNGKVRITGNAFVSGNIAVTSDENLKTNIDQLEGASELIGALSPKTFEFVQQDRPDLQLPGGQQIGLIAQELEQVLPALVMRAVQPAYHDTLGNEIAPQMEISMVNYIGLIPVLIGAVKEQQATISSIQAEMEQMRADLSVCCGTGTSDRRVLDRDHVVGQESDLRIIPNPVADQSELRYTVGSEGRVRLEITDASGRMIQLQDEGMRTTGTFSYAWNTTMLSPGTYFCTLYVNDEPLVKKAVKLNGR